MKIKVLVTGSEGQLGRELQTLAPENPLFDFTFINRSQWDLGANKPLLPILKNSATQYLVNAAAYTAVDAAESDEANCFNINAVAPGKMAKDCKEANVRLVQISSDYVFSDGRGKLIKEDHPKLPAGVYAKSKSLGEDLVLSNHPDGTLVVRTSWLYSSFGKNFVKTILRKGMEGSPLRVVADQHGSPTYARDLAIAIIKLIEVSYGRPIRESERILHYCNEGICTWYDLAEEILCYAGLSAPLAAIDTASLGACAPRPLFSGLDCSRIRNVLGITIPGWKDSLHQCLDLLLTNNEWK
ncbi:MAG: dTDP-4-dehydrorhamnose reductase [Saprospiraceae bacterium]|jgi:dTDP-4-dehydrorhamnose reductase|nr:dTDP-4-dehydrorhamnose reductase [Saprospiraceae bacterium]